jgi:uncharacterized protein (DUF2236 family)
MLIDRSELERCIALARGASRDPEAGLYGPGSMTWRLGAEAVLFLAGGAAALLQLAHPFVAYAVADHSATRADMLGRFVRTFENVHAMIFGTLDRATAAARRVHAIHTRVTGTLPVAVGAFPAGTPYAANDVIGLRWVHATLIQNAITAYELIVRPLAPRERAAYYEESKRFGLLFGLGEAHLPPDHDAFVRYYEDTLAGGTIAVSPAARDMAAYLLEPPHPSIAPAWRLYGLLTAGLLPPSVRAGYGLPFAAREKRVFDASIRALRLLYPRLPSRLRQVPAYIEAERRLRGDTSPDLLARLAQRLLRHAMRRRADSAATLRAVAVSDP